MIDIASTFPETHTWQYVLTVNPISSDDHCYAQLLLQLCPAFDANFSVDITEFDQEDRQRLKRFLDKWRLYSRLDIFLRSCDD